MSKRYDLHVYREPPSDIAYRGDVEASNCDWCRWKAGWHSWEGASCRHPLQRYRTAPNQTGHRLGVRERWNRDGTCERYEPTRLTRFLRLFGLRRPAWRDPQP